MQMIRILLLLIQLMPILIIKNIHYVLILKKNPILGNIVLRNPFPSLHRDLIFPLQFSLEENSKRRRRRVRLPPSFRSIIGVSHIFFIVRLHLARFDGAVTRLKLHRESNVLAAAPRENARLHRPRGHGQFRRDGDRYVWPLEPINNNPLRFYERKKKEIARTQKFLNKR